LPNKLIVSEEGLLAAVCLESFSLALENVLVESVLSKLLEVVILVVLQVVVDLSDSVLDLGHDSSELGLQVLTLVSTTFSCCSSLSSSL
jgi:hypothetical protein